MEIAAENKDQIVSMLKNGKCPICDKEGFRVILTHISMAHRMSAIDLKDTLLIPRDTSFIPEDLKAIKSDIVKKCDIAMKNLNPKAGANKVRNKTSETKRYLTRKSKGLFEAFKTTMNLPSTIKKRNATIKNKIESDAKFKKQLTERVINGHKRYLKQKETI